jgi:hypothetical protein
MTSFKSRQSKPGGWNELMAFRLVIAFLSVLIVVGSRLRGGFSEAIDFISVGIPLLPTLIYAVGARTRLAVMRYGSIILGLSAFTWLPFAVTGEPMWLLTLLPTTAAAFVLAILAVTDKSESRHEDPNSFRRPWWNPTG